jgi:hypothetical protein
VHEALLAELCLSEICLGPIRDGGRRTDNSEVTVVKAITLILPFAVGTMSSEDTDRSSTFLSNPAVKKK